MLKLCICIKKLKNITISSSSNVVLLCEFVFSNAQSALIFELNGAVYCTFMEFKYGSFSILNEGAFEKTVVPRFCPKLVNFNFRVNVYKFFIHTVANQLHIKHPSNILIMNKAVVPFLPRNLRLHNPSD